MTKKTPKNKKSKTEKKKVLSGYNVANKRGFVKGNPGRPKGAKGKTTLLKEKLLDYVLKLNLDETTTVTQKIGNRTVKKKVRVFRKPALLRLAVGTIPKEIKAKVTDTKRTFVDINVKTLGNEELNNELLKRLNQRHLDKEVLIPSEEDGD